MKERISLIWLFMMIMCACIVGIIGVGLPHTINFINGLDEESFYGYFCSYVVTALLFWLFVYNIRFRVKRESYFVLLRRFVENELKHSKEIKQPKGKKT